jgi:hypothetical protein
VAGPQPRLVCLEAELVTELQSIPRLPCQRTNPRRNNHPLHIIEV